MRSYRTVPYFVYPQLWNYSWLLADYQHASHMVPTLPPYPLPQLLCESHLHLVCLKVVNMHVKATSDIVGYTISELVVAFA